MKSKVIVLLTGTMVSLFLVARYLALSRAGVPLEWMLYLGLPVTGAGVLFALRLLELGAGWGIGTDEDAHARGATCGNEHRAQRVDIISETPGDPRAPADAASPRGRRRFRR